jgi:hypothetical protein
MVHIWGSQRGGINVQGDVLVNATADGVNLNAIFEELKQVLGLWAEERTSVASLVSHRVTVPADAISQSVTAESFELASETGVPRGAAVPPDALKLGYTLDVYDKASRFTWRYLKDASSEQVQAATTLLLEADNRLTTGLIMRRLFSPTEESNEWSHRCYGLYNGSDGIVPPPYMGRTFTSSVSHYTPSQTAVMDAGDVELAMHQINIKGFGLEIGSQLIILANPAESEQIQSWRAGVVSANGVKAKYDFIRSGSAPAYLTSENIVGAIPPNDFAGLKVQGSYGKAWLVESNAIPAGYFAVVATGGPDSDINPIAFRENANPAYQGLRVIAGPGVYPLTDSYFVRECGVGTRYRGAAAVCQITTDNFYTAPTFAV